MAQDLEKHADYEDLEQTDKYGPRPSDVSWAILFVVLFRFALLIGIPLAIIATIGPDLNELQQIAIYSGATLADLLFFALIAVYFTSWKYRRPFIDGIGLRMVSMSTLWRAVAEACVLLSYNLAIYKFLPNEPPKVAIWKLEPPIGAVALSVIALVQPFIYVLFYQGFVYSASRAKGKLYAILMTIGCYYCFELVSKGFTLQVTPPLLLSIVLTIQTTRYGSILPALLTAWLYNATIVLALAYCIATGVNV